MADLKARETGLRCALPRGSTIFGALSEDGEFVCYTLTSTEGVRTLFALSPEALEAMVVIQRKLRTAGVKGTLRHQRTGLPLKGCPAANAINGNHERDAYGHCALCGDGPTGGAKGPEHG